MKRVALVLLLAGCASSAEPADEPACPPVQTTSACEPAPTYTGDVAAVFAAACVSCHQAGGTAARYDLTSVAGVRRKGSTVLTQVQNCQMPPADAARPLDPAERALVLQWFACGAPD